LGLAETTLNAQSPEIVRAILEGSPEQDAWLWARAVNVVFHCGAGPAAEARVAHVSFVAVCLSRSAAGDFNHADLALQPFIANAADRQQLIWHLWEAGRRIIVARDVWPAVEAVAQEVLAGGLRDLNAVARELLPDAPASPLLHPVIEFAARAPSR